MKMNELIESVRCRVRSSKPGSRRRSKAQGSYSDSDATG